MTQTRDLIKKMAEFFKGEEFYEKGEDARLELSPDDVRCMNYLIQQRNKALEHEPCEDCIRRQAVKEVFPRWKFISYEAYLCAVAEIDALPSVNTQPICEEREKGECPYYAR